MKKFRAACSCFATVVFLSPAPVWSTGRPDDADRAAVETSDALRLRTVREAVNRDFSRRQEPS